MPRAEGRKPKVKKTATATGTATEFEMNKKEDGGQAEHKHTKSAVGSPRSAVGRSQAGIQGRALAPEGRFLPPGRGKAQDEGDAKRPQPQPNSK